MKISVGVIFGGKSVEHEVSIISANQAMCALNKDKYDVVPIYLTKDNRFFCGEALLDIKKYKDIPTLLASCTQVVLLKSGVKALLNRAFPKAIGKNTLASVDIFLPVVHGTNVEDGTLQGFLELLGLPYCGCDVTASALGMDKFAMKAVLKESGVNVLPARCFSAKDCLKNARKAAQAVEGAFKYPVIVKPVNTGSSVGIKKAADREELIAALEFAAEFSERVLVERAIVSLREINCSVLGDFEETSAGVLEEPVSADEILSYRDKYMGGSKSGAKGMGGSARKIPAELDPDAEKTVREMAVAAFRAIGASGVARVDLMIDQGAGEIFVNEINTIPGSLSFYLWEKAGLSFSQLLDQMLYFAQKRARERESVNFSYETNLLSDFDPGSLKGGK